MNWRETYAGNAITAWKTFLTAVSQTKPQHIKPHIISLEARIRGVGAINPVQQGPKTPSATDMQNASDLHRYMRVNEPNPIDLAPFHTEAKNFLRHTMLTEILSENFKLFTIEYLTAPNAVDAREQLFSALLQGIKGNQRKGLKEELEYSIREIERAMLTGNPTHLDEKIANANKKYLDERTMMMRSEMKTFLRTYLSAPREKFLSPANRYTYSGQPDINTITYQLEQGIRENRNVEHIVEEISNEFLSSRRRATRAQTQQNIIRKDEQRKREVNNAYRLEYKDRQQPLLEAILREQRAEQKQTTQHILNTQKHFATQYGASVAFYAPSTLEKITKVVATTTKTLGVSIIKGIGNLFHRDTPKAYDGYTKRYA